MTAPADNSADDTTEQKESRAALFAGIGLRIPNRGPLGHLIESGRIGYAEERGGRVHADIHIRGDELQYDPAIVIVARGGDIDVDFYNDDTDVHCALVPSNGDPKWVWLPARSHGTCTVNLDGPGMYWYGSNVGKDEGRGLTGVIVVRGEEYER